VHTKIACCLHCSAVAKSVHSLTTATITAFHFHCSAVAKFVPSPTTLVCVYNTIVLKCRGGALDLMREMQQAGVPPDAVTYNAVMNACAKAGKSGKALEVLQHMKDAHVQLTVATYGTALDACARRAEWERSFFLLHEMREEPSLLQPDEACYSAAINSCVRAGRWQEALQLLRDMKAEGMKPNQITACAAINACTQGGQPQLALDLLEEMRRTGMEPDTVTYTAVMRACKQSGQWQRSLDLLVQMESEGVKIGSSTWYAVISACSEECQWREASHILAEMMTRGITPTVQFFSVAMIACVNAQQWQAALDLFATVPRPDLTCYNAALYACEKGGLGDVALELMASMKGDCAPNADTYRHTIAAIAASPATMLISTATAAQQQQQKRSDSSSSDDVTAVDSGNDDQQQQQQLQQQQRVEYMDAMYSEAVYKRLIKHWRRGVLVLSEHTHTPHMAAAAIRMVLNSMLGRDSQLLDEHVHDSNTDLFIVCKATDGSDAYELYRAVAAVLKQHELDFAMDAKRGRFVVFSPSLAMMCMTDIDAAVVNMSAVEDARAARSKRALSDRQSANVNTDADDDSSDSVDATQ
jgi:pentatricopeptide repeat protein